MAAFNDPQKLADAIALAQSFKTGQFSEKRQRNAKSRADANGVAGSSKIHHDLTGYTHEKRVAERNRQYAAAGFVQPSQRQYSSDALSKGWQIGQHRAEDAVIGKAVFDFLNRNDIAPTPAATPSPIVRLPPTSQTTQDFIRPRSPTLASASTPLTPESLIQEPGDYHASPAGSPQKPTDGQAADQLAELLSSFSFQEKSSKGDGPGHIMDRFLELLAKNVEMSEHLSQDKQSCVKNSHTTTHSDAEQEDKGDLKEPVVAYQNHQPKKADEPVFANANTVPPTTKGTQLSPKAPAFAPSKAESANGGIVSFSSKETTVTDNDQHREKKLPFTGQFSPLSDGTPHGHWPATERATPACPLTYTIWVPVDYPMPNVCSHSTMIMDGMQAAAPNLSSRQPQPIQGLSASRWAQPSPKETG